MRLSVVSFTEKGKQLSEKIATVLERGMRDGQGDGFEIEACFFTKCKACMEKEAHSPVLYVQTPIAEWTKGQMQERSALLFIGACGIAVRAIASSLTDKLHDAPVLVMDEHGKYIIPILSGHMGGANELANGLAKKMGAEPVITTATDINQTFAVDLFAKKNGLLIVNKDGIVKVSSKILAGGQVTMSIEPRNQEITKEKEVGDGRFRKDGLPYGIRLIPYPPAEAVDIVVTSEDRAFEAAILLKPKEYIIGMGCKRGKSKDEIGHLITTKLETLGITPAQIFALASVSQKSDEQGIIEWCQKERVPFFTYTAEELREVEGNFSGSSFVKAQIGVDNVCERAALKACEGEGKLVASKYAENGMTIAIAKRDWRICLDGE